MIVFEIPLWHHLNHIFLESSAKSVPRTRMDKVEAWLQAIPREPTKASLSTAAEIVCEPCLLIQEGQKRELGRKGSKAMRDVDRLHLDSGEDLYIEEDPWLKDLNEYFTDPNGAMQDVDRLHLDSGEDLYIEEDPWLKDLNEGGDFRSSVSPTLAALDLRHAQDPQCPKVESSRLRRGRDRPSHDVDTQPLKAAKNATSSPHDCNALWSYLKRGLRGCRRGLMRLKTGARKQPNSQGFVSEMCSGARRGFSTSFRSLRQSSLASGATKTSNSASTVPQVDIKFVAFEDLSMGEKVRAYCGYYDGLEQEQKMYALPPAAYCDMLMKEYSAIYDCKATVSDSSRVSLR